MATYQIQPLQHPRVITNIGGLREQDLTCRKMVLDRFQIDSCFLVFMTIIDIGLYRWNRETQWPNGQCFGSRSRGLGSRPGRVIVLCSWARHFTLTVHLSTQEGVGTGELSGKPDKMPEGNHVLDWHPIQEGMVILLDVSCDM